MTESAQIILEFTTKTRKALNNIGWISNMANNLAQMWKIHIQVEPIENGFILFCQDKESFVRLLEQLGQNFTPDPKRNHPDLVGLVKWNLRFAKHPPHIPIERCIEFILNGLKLVYGDNLNAEVNLEQKSFLVDFPANITASNLLTKSLERKDQKQLEEMEKYLTE